VYVFWNVAGKVWNIGGSLDEVKPVYGYASLDETMECPPDGSRYSTYVGTAIAETGYAETGYLYQLESPIDGVCSPVGGTLSPPGTDTNVSAVSVSECVRLLAKTPQATAGALSLVGGKCFASSNFAVELDTKSTDVKSCLKVCNALPGSPADFKGSSVGLDHIPQGDGTSIQQCMGFVVVSENQHNGASYTGSSCYGTSNLQTIDVTDKGSHSCFFVNGLNPNLEAARDDTPLPLPGPSPGHHRQ